MIDKTQALKLLEKWQDTYYRNTELCTSVEAIFGQTDSKFYDAIWHGFDKYTEALAAGLGDIDGWLSWYAYENDLGAKGFEGAPPGGKLRKIKTLAGLYKIIVESSHDKAA